MPLFNATIGADVTVYCFLYFFASNRSRPTEESCAQNKEGAASGKQRKRASSSGSEGRGALLRPSSSTDDEASAAALAEEERRNTLGKEQSAKIVTYKIIRELIAEGLLTELV